MKTIKKITMFMIMLFVGVIAFAQDGAVPESGFKAVWAFIQNNWGWIASVLFIVSESLAGSKLKANSIYQLVIGWLKKKSTFPK